MKVYLTQKEVEADIKDGMLIIKDDVMFECSIKISASISAWDISALDISAWNISAEDISARNISARNISAGDISVGDISACNISAGDISACNILAEDISYFAVCYAYLKFACKSIKGRRQNARHFCLDSEVVVNGGSK